MPNKNVPSNLEAEQSVIGSMFLSKYALEKACETLTKESFYYHNNALIFDVIKDMSEHKKPIDLTTITSELKSKNLLNEVGGVEYLSEVLEMVPTAANAEYYIKSVSPELREIDILAAYMQVESETARKKVSNFVKFFMPQR